MRYCIGPALEESAMAPGAVDDRQYKEPVSAGSHMQVYGNAVVGIVKALARIQALRGVAPEQIQAKSIELINLFKSNGDVDSFTVKYIVELDFSDCTRRTFWDEFAKVDQNNSYCGNFWDIYEYTCYGLKDAKWNPDYRDKMNDREKELIDRLDNARRAYWKAQEEFEEYIHDHAITVLNDILFKYNEALSKIDSEWYSELEERVKREMAEVERRRKQKQGEDTATALRPVSA